MKTRAIVNERLARLMSVLSHPHRLRIVEELGVGEQDVAALQSVLGIRHSSVSQHLAQLRAHAITAERRVGRHVFYRLTEPRLAAWILDGLRFIEPGDEHVELKHAVRRARATWRLSAATSVGPRTGRRQQGR